MPDSRLHKPSDLDKRFKLLNQQLYGKPIDQQVNPDLIGINNPAKLTDTRARSDTTYLRHDLTKIALFASLALAAQAILYISLNNHLVKLPI